MFEWISKELVYRLAQKQPVVIDFSFNQKGSASAEDIAISQGSGCSSYHTLRVDGSRVSPRNLTAHCVHKRRAVCPHAFIGMAYNTRSTAVLCFLEGPGWRKTLCDYYNSIISSLSSSAERTSVHPLQIPAILCRRRIRFVHHFEWRFIRRTIHKPRGFVSPAVYGAIIRAQVNI